jgi:hypothetical protein
MGPKEVLEQIKEWGIGECRLGLKTITFENHCALRDPHFGLPDQARFSNPGLTRNKRELTLVSLRVQDQAIQQLKIMFVTHKYAADYRVVKNHC